VPPTATLDTRPGVVPTWVSLVVASSTPARSTVGRLLSSMRQFEVVAVGQDTSTAVGGLDPGVVGPDLQHGPGGLVEDGQSGSLWSTMRHLQLVVEPVLGAVRKWPVWERPRRRRLPRDRLCTVTSVYVPLSRYGHHRLHEPMTTRTGEALHAIGYRRVSTRDQADEGHGLDAQTDALERWTEYPGRGTWSITAVRRVLLRGRPTGVGS